MKKIILAVALMLISLPASAAWEAVHSEGGTVTYVENSNVPLGEGFWQADIFVDYTNAINSDKVCLPSGSDCQWKKTTEKITYQFFCNQVVRLVKDEPVWTGGPISESYNPQTHTYDSPPVYSTTMPNTAAAPGSVYNITNEANLLAVERRVCLR